MWFITEFLIPNHYNVYISEVSVTEQHKRFFEESNIHIIACPRKVLDWINKGKPGNCFTTLFMYILLMNSVYKSEHYDIINIHYVEWFDVVLCSFLKKMQKSKLILSYWGSDLFRTSDVLLRRIGRLLKNVDYVTIDNEDMKTMFEDIYPQATNIRHRVVYLGLPILNLISMKQNSNNADEIRKRWSIPPDKKVVAIGYNAKKEQQHLEVIKCIKHLDEQERERIVLLFQMTYGRDESYCLQVKKAAEDTGCRCFFFDSFLSDEEVAEIRIITDIYINAQITDAFSGSVCENLFAGNIVVNATWLRYQEFETNNFMFIEFSDWEDLNEQIRIAIMCEKDLRNNKDLVWSMRSWEECAPKWEAVYNEVLAR